MTKVAIVDITNESFWKVPDFFIEELCSEFKNLNFVHAKNMLSLKKDIEGCEAIISIPTLPNVIKRVSSIEAIFIVGSGIPDSVLQLNKQRPSLKVSNMAGINASSVADQALYLTLKGTRADGIGNSPRRCDQLSVLVIGTGFIARDVEKRFKSIFAKTTLAGRDNPGVENFVSLDCLNKGSLEKYDVVILALAYNDETAKIIDINFLRELNSDSIFVNVARAEFFKEQELVSFLKGQSGFLYLTDLTLPEPYPEDGVLKKLQNFYSTPHMGGTYDLIWSDYLTKIKTQLKDYFVC